MSQTLTAKTIDATQVWQNRYVKIIDQAVCLTDRPGPGSRLSQGGAGYVKTSKNRNSLQSELSGWIIPVTTFNYQPTKLSVDSIDNLRDDFLHTDP